MPVCTFVLLDRLEQLHIVSTGTKAFVQCIRMLARCFSTILHLTMRTREIENALAFRADRRALNEARDDQTRITHAFSGRPARGLENRYLLEMAGHEARYPDFPILNTLTGPLRKASAKQNNPDFLSLWAGQSAVMSRNLPARELIQLLVTETESVLEGLVTKR